ncbi:WD40 repeat domain-containing protein [Candidatus Dependentiae bacterium]|nr:WD40 repeat domain-containing protein [Candidatus Dependentiae bacterium]
MEEEEYLPATGIQQTSAPQFPFIVQDDTGNIEVTVPAINSEAYQLLKKVVASSVTLKNMAEDDQAVLQAGSVITLPKLSLGAVQAIFSLANSGVLDDAKLIEKSLENFTFTEIAYVAQAANYLDIEKLLKASVNALVKRLQSSNALAELNARQGIFNQINALLPQDLQKMVTNNLISALGLPFSQSESLTELSEIDSVAFSPDGGKIAYGSRRANKATIIVWDLVLKKDFALIQVETRPENVLFSPDGKKLVAGSITRDLSLFDFPSGKQLKAIPVNTRSIAFSPNSLKLALAEAFGPNVIIWDIMQEKQIQTLQGHTASAHSVKFSPDGKMVASGGQDFSVIIWDLATGNKLKTLTGHSHIINSVAFSPDGTKLASGGNDGFIVWDLATGNKLQSNDNEKRLVTSVAFNEHGTKLAVGGQDSITIWDALTGKKLQTLEAKGVQNVVFNSNGKLASAQGVGGIKGSVIIWESDELKLKSLSLKQLIIFLIAKEAGVNALNKEFADEYKKLPAEVKALLEKK